MIWVTLVFTLCCYFWMHKVNLVEIILLEPVNIVYVKLFRRSERQLHLVTWCSIPGDIRYHSLIMECWECSVIIMSCIGCERGCKCRWVFATKMQNSYWEPCNFVLKSSEDKNDEGEIKHDQLGSAIRKCSYNWYKASQLMFPYATIS